MKTPEPRYRQNYGYYGLGHATEYPDGTWIEPEAFAYPRDTFTRRAYATFPDGKKRVCLCKVADTYFTIPARAKLAGKTVRGYLAVNEAGGVSFHPKQNGGR